MDEKEFQGLQEKMKHGDALFPIVKYHTELPEHYTSFPVHWHEEMEVIIVREGKMQFFLDLQPYIVSAGDILVLSPHTLHSFTRLPQEFCRTETLVFHLNLIDNSTVDLCSLKYFTPIRNKEVEFPFVICSKETGYEELKEYLEAMFWFYDSKKAGSELSLKAAVLQFFSVLLYYFQREGRKKEPQIEKMKSVLQYIRENYSKDISIAELSGISNLSEYHLMRCFKQCSGMTCIEYINHYRMTVASERLRSSDQKVTAIALEVGFNHISYFNKIFKRSFGMTPMKYRENSKREKGGS